jgi:hypothetical protein
MPDGTREMQMSGSQCHIDDKAMRNCGNGGSHSSQVKRNTRGSFSSFLVQIADYVW